MRARRRQPNLRVIAGAEASEPKQDTHKVKKRRITLGGRHRTQLGLAERFRDRVGDIFRYVQAWRKWLVWDGMRWAVDDSGAANRAMKQTVRGILDEAANADEDREHAELLKYALQCEKRSTIADALTLAQSESQIAARPTDFDADQWLLTVNNGVLDLRTGELLPHDAKRMLTKLVPIDYDPNAQCQRWEKFVMEVMNNRAELVEFLQRAVGYSLSASCAEQVLFFLIGGGDNGKSVFVKVLQALLGEFSLQAASDLLLATKSDAHPTGQASLFGKRLAVCVEVEKGRSFAEVTVKQLTGNDRITARRMREDYWEFEPTHKIWFSANHKPIVRGTDHAIWRRLLLIPFDVKFEGETKDAGLIDKLMGELPGILRWAVEGCLKWQQSGLAVPEVVRAAVDEYRAEMDVMGQFLETCVEQAPTETIVASKLYEVYQLWCRATGEHANGQRVFGLAMSERGLAKEKVGTVRYLGMRLTPEAQRLLNADFVEGFPMEPGRSSS